MTKDDYPEFGRAYNRLCAALQKVPDRDQAVVFFQVLQPLPLASVVAPAVLEAFTRFGDGWMPKVPEWYRAAAKHAQDAAKRELDAIVKGHADLFCMLCSDTGWLQRPDGAGVIRASRCACRGSNPRYLQRVQEEAAVHQLEPAVTTDEAKAVLKRAGGLTRLGQI